MARQETNLSQLQCCRQEGIRQGRQEEANAVSPDCCSNATRRELPGASSKLETVTLLPSSFNDRLPIIA